MTPVPTWGNLARAEEAQKHEYVGNTEEMGALKQGGSLSAARLQNPGPLRMWSRPGTMRAPTCPAKRCCTKPLHTATARREGEVKRSRHVGPAP